MNMNRNYAWIIVGAGLLASQGALAAPITIDFTVTATSVSSGGSSYGGYTIGALGGGSISFDDVIGTFNNTVSGLAATSLSFTWLGTTWNETSAKIWDLQFDSGGTLQRWGIGGVPGTCALNCFNNPGPTDFWLLGFAPGSSQGSQVGMHLLNVNGSMFGSVAWNIRPTPVPEPATLSLFSLGLLAAAAVRRKQKR